MKYHKTMNLLHDKTNHPPEFRKINSVEINHESRGLYKLVIVIKLNLKP